MHVYRYCHGVCRDLARRCKLKCCVFGLRVSDSGFTLWGSGFGVSSIYGPGQMT